MIEIIKINGKDVEIDSNCVNLVNYFNENGLATKFCCEGHKLGDEFYIMFDDSVTDYKIIEFLNKHQNDSGYSIFIGKFIKWFRNIEGKTKCNWMYIVNCKKRAEKDYETMIKNEGERC